MTPRVGFGASEGSLRPGYGWSRNPSRKEIAVLISNPSTRAIGGTRASTSGQHRDETVRVVLGVVGQGEFVEQPPVGTVATPDEEMELSLVGLPQLPAKLLKLVWRHSWSRMRLSISGDACYGSKQSMGPRGIAQ